MATCKNCSGEYTDKRYDLGYKTCLDCGDKIAIKEAYLKSRYTAHLYNKGAYQYIGTIDNIRNVR